MMLLRIATVGSLIGATALNAFATLPRVGWVIALVSIGVSIGGLVGVTYRRVGWLAISIGLGFGWAYFHAHQRLAAQCPLSDCYTPVQVSGTVTGIALIEGNQSRFELQSRERGKIRLYWRDPAYPLKAGDQLTLKVTFSYPWRLANPGCFDIEKQLFKEAINATGTVIACLDYQPTSRWSMARIRQSLYEQLLARYANKPLLPLIGATTLGLYGDMTAHQFDVFAATGTLHAIAISGSHIAIIAWFCTLIATFVSRQCCWITQVYPAQHVGAIAGMLGAWFYAALAGFGIPTQRALIMILIALLALLQGKKILTWDLLAIAWLAVGLWDPLSTLDNGFWLSFGCVAILIATQSMTTGAWWRRWILPQWFVFGGMMLPSVLFFQQIAFISPIANMLTLPLVGVLAVPLSLMGVLLLGVCTPLADALIACAHGILTLAWRILEPLAALPLCVSVAFPGSIPPAACRITVLDVGQGLSVFVQTAQHRLLFDTGPQYGLQNAGTRVIKPFLKSQKIDRIDTLIISHGDLDHRGGWVGLQDFPIQTIYSSEPALISEHALPCVSGTTWTWDGVVFTLLNDSHSSRDSQGKKRRHHRNNQSCVLKIQAAHHSALMTGDIEKEAEGMLIRAWGGILASDILVVPHHGSLSSSTVDFVRHVSPQYAVYPVGFHNRYRLPRQEIVERYQTMGAKNYLTYETGAITFTLDASKELASPICWRYTHQHYWSKPND